jgi:uncharacterized membrane protein YqjE
MSRADNLSARVLSASVWSIAAEVIAGGARALSYVVYAKLLSPTDFGLVGIALLLISLFPLLIDTSLGLALVRLEKEDQKAFSAIFYVNVALSLVAVGALCLLALPAATLLHDERIVAVLPALSIQLLLNSLGAVHLAVARRRFQYRRLVPIRLLSTACSLALGIALALHGTGYWSLVVASVAGALVQLIATWALVQWRPSRICDWGAARGISGFTSWVALDMAVTWMAMSGGGFFLALFLGTHDLGLFRLSDQINTYLFGSLLNPLIPVLYSAYCEVNAEPQKLRPLFRSTARAVGLVALSVSGATVVLSHPLELLIGPKWQGIGTVIALNAVADGISYAILPSPSFMRSQGRARAVAYLRMGLVAGQVVVYSFVAARGLQWFIVGKLGLELVMYVASYCVLRGAFAIPVLRLVAAQAAQALGVAACVGIGVLVANATALTGPAPSMAAGLLAFGIPLVLFILLAERQTLLRLFRSMQPRR